MQYKTPWYESFIVKLQYYQYTMNTPHLSTAAVQKGAVALREMFVAWCYILTCNVLLLLSFHIIRTTIVVCTSYTEHT